MSQWQPIATAPLDTEVMTKIDDDRGERNVCPLIGKRRGEGFSTLWFFPDMSMYVYYTPTHWRSIEKP